MDNKNNEAVDGVVASEEISLEEQQAVLEKFDQESNTRNVTGFAKGFIKWYSTSTHLSLDFGLQFARGPCTCCL